eukprot:6176087-Prymnesium_polylepis.1
MTGTASESTRGHRAEGCERDRRDGRRRRAAHGGRDARGRECGTKQGQAKSQAQTTASAAAPEP